MRLRALPYFLVFCAVLFSAVGGFAAIEFAWSDRLDGGGSLADHGRVVILDPSGNPIVGGETTERIGGAAIFVRKMDRLSGEQIWAHRIPAYDGSDMSVRRMELDPSGNVMVSGYIAGCGT